jgi:hypothetical protein
MSRMVRGSRQTAIGGSTSPENASPARTDGKTTAKSANLTAELLATALRRCFFCVLSDSGSASTQRCDYNSDATTADHSPQITDHSVIMGVDAEWDEPWVLDSA